MGNRGNYKNKRLSMMQKKRKAVSRAYGGNLCHSAVRLKIIRAFLSEECRIASKVRKTKRKNRILLKAKAAKTSKRSKKKMKQRAAKKLQKAKVRAKAAKEAKAAKAAKTAKATAKAGKGTKKDSKVTKGKKGKK